MKLIDANLLIYAHIEEMPLHERSHQWLDQQLNDSPRVALPWASLLAFVRLVSNPRIFDRSVPVSAAWNQVESSCRRRRSGSPQLPTGTRRSSGVC